MMRADPAAVRAGRAHRRRARSPRAGLRGRAVAGGRGRSGRGGGRRGRDLGAADLGREHGAIGGARRPELQRRELGVERVGGGSSRSCSVLARSSRAWLELRRAEPSGRRPTTLSASIACWPSALAWPISAARRPSSSGSLPNIVAEPLGAVLVDLDGPRVGDLTDPATRRSSSARVLSSSWIWRSSVGGVALRREPLVGGRVDGGADARRSTATTPARRDRRHAGERERDRRTPARSRG